MAGKILSITLVVSIMLAVSAYEKTPKEEGCYFEDVKKFLPVGSDVTPIGKCVKITCTGNRMFSVLTCPEVRTDDPNCYFTEINLSVSYPHCCPNLKCN